MINFSSYNKEFINTPKIAFKQNNETLKANNNIPKLVEGRYETVVSDILSNTNKDYSMTISARSDLKTPMIKISKTITNNQQHIIIENVNENNKIAEFDGSIDAKLPHADFKIGKYGPALEFDNFLVAAPDSEINSNSFNFKFFSNNTKNKLSFKGDLYVSVRPETRNAINQALNSYKTSKIPNSIKSNDSAKDFNFIMPASGEGSRIKILTDCKAALNLPAKDYSLIANNIEKGYAVGALDEKSNFHIMQDSTGSAGFISNSIDNGEIPTDKPVILTYCDTFSNIDMTNAIEKYKNNPAGIVVVGYPVPWDIAKNHGLLSINNNGILEDCIEKPKTKEDAEKSKLTDDKYLLNTAMMIIHPDILKEIPKQKEELRLQSEKPKEFIYDLCKDFLPKIVNDLNNGKIVNNDGEKLKSFFVPAESVKSNVNVKWKDLGTLEQYAQTMRAVAHDEFKGLPELVTKEIKENVLKNNVIIMPECKESYNKFIETYKINSISGNIIAKNNEIK